MTRSGLMPLRESTIRKGNKSMELRDIATIVLGKGAEIIENEKKKIEKSQNAKEQYFDQSGANIFSALFDVGSHGEYLSYKTIAKHSSENLLIANCYIPKADGSNTEIDIIMVHNTGIYVFESKNYSGYIFGSENQRMWTQTLNAGRRGVEKNQFYNPIMQNEGHIKYLKKLIGRDDIPFYSYIIFSDRCEFKSNFSGTSMAKVLHRNRLGRVLDNDIETRTSIINDDTARELFAKLDSLSHASKEEKQEHVSEIKEKRSMVEQKICPVCKGNLVLRTARNTGAKFYGCSNYPNCKFTTKC